MLRAAAYGLGRWGNRLIESIAESSKIRVTTGISRDPSQARGVQRQTGIKVVSSYADVLKDPAIDAVILATPHSLHCEHIVQAAKAGKHVFVEKPFALTRKSAEEAIDATRAAGVTLAVGFNRRFAPAFVEMMRRIEAGEIGDILHVEGQNSGATGYSLKAGNWRATRQEAPGGGMTARGIHALDCMIRMAGPVATRVCELAEAQDAGRDRHGRHDRDAAQVRRRCERVPDGGVRDRRLLARAGVRKQGLARDSQRHGTDRARTRRCTANDQAAAVDKERAELEAFADAVAAKQLYTVPPAEVVNGIAVLESIEKSSASGAPIRIA